MLSSDHDGNYNLAQFRDNLDQILSEENPTSGELKNVGIDLKLIQELNSCLKIIEMTYKVKAKRGSGGPTFGGDTTPEKLITKTKRYLLAYCSIENRGHVSLMQFNQGQADISERMVLILS